MPGIETRERALRKGRRLRKLTGGIVFFLLSVLLFLWYIGVFGGNVRAVVPGKVYRSAQLTGRNLEEVLETYRIRTVINLRGGSEKDGWFRSERESAKRYDATFITAAFSAVRMPPPDQLRRLLQTFDRAAYPVLFHCRGGADRSGLAGTLYLHLYENVPLDEAQARQLTLRYGHIRWGQARPMDDFFDLYRRTANGQGLREWIETRYPALYQTLPERLKAPAPDVTPLQSNPLRSAPAGVERGRALSSGGG